MNPTLAQNWRIDDLERAGLRIIQDAKGFRFGMDAVLLAHFCCARTKDGVLDLGAGNGILPLLIHGLFSPKRLVGVEIQKTLVDMARQSAALNGLGERIAFHVGDYRDAALMRSLGRFTLVVSNPPYHPVDSGDLCRGEAERIARFEVSSTLLDVVRAASAALTASGRFCMVHLPKRLCEILQAMQAHALTPKRLLMVHPSANKQASLVLIEGVKHAKPGMAVRPPLFVHEAGGHFTPAMRALYQGGTAL
jgi:tRNA1Val (adenine37-N6)-methyltransferase